MGWNATFSMAVGGMIGDGIFSVLGVVVDIAGSWAWASFVLGGAVAFVTSLSYIRLAELSPRRPRSTPPCSPPPASPAGSPTTASCPASCDEQNGRRGPSSSSALSAQQSLRSGRYAASSKHQASV